MTTIISLPTSVRNTITVAIGNVIDTLGKECKLYYPPKLIPCVNCTGTNGVWKTGGPMPFAFGVCPLCGGQNVKTEEATTTITMTLDWNPQKYLYLLQSTDVRNPKNLILSRGFIADMPKVAQCDHMKILNIDNYKHFNFRLVGEPVDPHNIAQGNFFMAFWERNG